MIAVMTHAATPCYIRIHQNTIAMYTRERGKRTFVPDTPQFHHGRYHKTWWSLLNIIIVFLIIIALLATFLIIL